MLHLITGPNFNVVQVLGDASRHMQIRQELMDYIDDHREDFEWFIEDDEPFDDYVLRLRTNGEWGGHLELRAASLHLRCTVVIHQLAMPRWEMPNPESTDTIHLSYHDGEHYASVRAKSDPGDGPALPIVIGAPKSVAVERAPRAEDPTEDELLVMRSTPGSTHFRVREVLGNMGGDVSLAIEVLIAEAAEAAEAAARGEPRPAFGGAAGGAGAAAADEPAPGATETSTADASVSAAGGAEEKAAASTKPEKPKPIRRNGPCPCGSGLRYKKCCYAREKAAERL